MHRPRRILVAGPTDVPTTMMLDALREAVRQRPDWKLRIQFDWPQDPQVQAGLAAWHPDGILTVIGPPPAGFLTKLPVVGLRATSVACRVEVDNHQVGVLAADTLLAVGHRTCAILGLPDDGDGWATWRHRGFCERLAACGHQPLIIPLIWPPTWTDLPIVIAQALRSLSQRPCAIFTGNDYFAEATLEACESLRLRVPEDVAILGADDVPGMDRLAVPLSSIAVPHAEVALAGLAALETLWSGRQPAPLVRLLPARHAVLRRSTERALPQDPVAQAALEFIHRHPSDRLDVVAVARRSGVSRRTLEQHFRQATGRTVKQEIDRSLADLAVRLLRESRRSIQEISIQLGFSEGTSFARMLRRVTGRSPREHRKNGKEGG